MVLRVNGKVGVIQDPADYKGLWAFTLQIWDAESGTMLDEFPPVGPYETEKQALEKLDDAAKAITGAIEKKARETSGGKIIDLNTGNVLSSWGEQ